MAKVGENFELSDGEAIIRWMLFPGDFY